MFSFKKFFENYDNHLEDELGISWEDFVRVYDDNGNGQLNQDFNTFLKIGNEVYKGFTFQIVPGSLNKNGASVLITSKTRSYLPGNKLDGSDLNGKIYHLNKKQLLNLLTRGWINY
jgi:hypothetical protein